MKKHLVLAAGILFGTLALPAQMQLLKDAKRAETPQQVIEILTPAFTNPETAQLAETYVIPGKALFDEYDQLLGWKSFGKLPEGGDLVMANDLLGGYEFYMKALPLDSLPNEKGKIKTKYSREIINTISGHFADYNSAALTYWENKQYEGAYAAWEIFLSLAKNPTFARTISTVPADTLLGELCFNQALAAWQADKLENALSSFEKAKTMGYNKKQMFDYAIAVASNMSNNDAVYAWAVEAQPLYGNEDSNYFGYIINHYLQNKDFDKAFSIINEAIANNPNNAQYYLVKGILYDNQAKNAEAKAMFKKALELDSQNSQILYNYGRSICQEAYALSDTAPTDPEEADKFYNEKLVPLFKEAADYLEQAWNIDNENRDALNYLENVYYNLQDETMLKDVQNRKLQ